MVLNSCCIYKYGVETSIQVGAEYLFRAGEKISLLGQANGLNFIGTDKKIWFTHFFLE